MITIDELDPSQIVPEPNFECDACRDSGFVTTSGTEQRVRRCLCRSPGTNPKLLREAMRSSGMELDEIDSAFTPWDEGHQPKPHFAREWLMNLLLGKPGRMKNPWCLGLIGETGRGKTKTAAVLMRLYIESGGKDPLWLRVPEAFDQVQLERQNSFGVEVTLESKIERSRFVVLDDFGIVHRADPGLMEATVCEWLARRHRRHGPSVFTSNAPNLSAIGAPRIESRLSEGVYKLMTARSDYRDEKSDLGWEQAKE